jgi:hypothetical protein
MFIAVLLYVVHRWATGKTAVDVQVVVGGAFAILVIAMLDQGKTEPVAKGFAWLFVLVAAYNAIPDIHAAASGNKAVKPAPKKAGA